MSHDDERVRPEDRGLLEEAKRLPRRLEPERDLWPGIESRLAVERPPAPRVVRGDFTRPTLLAAAAVLVVCLVALATGMLRRGTAVPGGLEATAAGPVDLEALDAGYAAVSQDVLDALSRDRDLDPATVELIRENLAVIDGAIEEIRAALADDPGNPGLARLLTAEYQRRGVVLRKAARLADTI